MQPMHLDRESAITAAEPMPAPAVTLLELDQPVSAPGRSLTRDSILFGLGTFAGKASGFIVVPILARLLAPEAFGRLDVLNALVSSGLLIVMLGTDVATVRLFFDRSTDEERRRLFATWGVVVLSIAAIPTVVLIAGADPISSALFGSTQLGPAIALVGVALMAGIVHFVTLGVLRATGRPLPYALLEGGALAVNALLAVVLVATWRADATAVMLALAISWSTAAVIGLVVVRGSIIARPSGSAARAILALALPLAPAIGATWGADFFHRAFLLGTTGATQAAYLSMATRIGSIAMLVVAAAQLAWHPHAYRLGVTPDATRRLAAEGRQILVALVVTVGLLGLFAPEVLQAIGGDPYRGAAPALGLFLVSVLGVGVFTIASLASAIERRTGDIGTAVVIGVTVAVALNLALARTYGAVGTAFAIAIGQFVAAGIATLLGRRRLAIPFAWRPVLALVVVAIVVVLASTVTGPIPVVGRLALGLGLLIGLLAEGTLPHWLAIVRDRGRRSERG